MRVEEMVEGITPQEIRALHQRVLDRVERELRAKHGVALKSRKDWKDRIGRVYSAEEFFSRVPQTTSRAELEDLIVEGLMKVVLKYKRVCTLSIH